MIIDFRVQKPRKDRVAARADYMKRYTQVFDLESVSYSEDELLGALQQAGIGRAVMQAEWASGDYCADNDSVAAIVKRHPEVFVGFASVNAADGMAAVDELKRCVEKLGLRGLNVQPFASQLHANDKKFYPLYLKCLEYDVPVTIHTGINYSSDRTLAYGRPLIVDEVACDFPGLRIVLNHGGWPWVNEAVAVARKHRNVYIEIGGIAPKYLAKPNSGWEMLLAFGDNLLQEQVLFATDSMIPFQRAVEEAKALPLKEKTRENLLWRNAARLLGEKGA
jgi:uncharacterized protein